MIPRDLTKLSHTMVVQLIMAVFALLATWSVFSKLGATFFAEFSTISAVYVVINYFDFGAIGMARRAGASDSQNSSLSRGQLKSIMILIVQRMKWIPLVGMCLLVGLRFMGVEKIGGAQYWQAIIVAICFSPLFVCVGALRGYFEGSGWLIRASILRGGSGLVIASSPLVAALISYDGRGFHYVPPFFAFLVVVGVFLWLAQTNIVRKDLSSNLRLSGRVELVYTISGVFFLYFDRYAMSVIGGGDSVGLYLLALEMASRASLLYVPIVMNGYAKMVKLTCDGYLQAYNHITKIALRAALAVLVSFVGVILVGVGWRSLLPREMNSGYFLFSFGCVAAAYVATAMIFSYQKYLSVVAESAKQVSKIYIALTASAIACVVAFGLSIGAEALPIVFLVRALAELAVIWILSNRVVAARSLSL